MRAALSAPRSAPLFAMSKRTTPSLCALRIVNKPPAGIASSDTASKFSSAFFNRCGSPLIVEIRSSRYSSGVMGGRPIALNCDSKLFTAIRIALFTFTGCHSGAGLFAKSLKPRRHFPQILELRAQRRNRFPEIFAESPGRLLGRHR